MHVNGPKRRDQMKLFARNFLRHPRMLGSLIPSSRFLVEVVLDEVDWQRARVVVEYGPGVGNFTASILERLPDDGTLVVLETNPEFVGFLRASFTDPRLHVIERSAEDVGRVLANLGHQHADYIISGIPFTTIPAAVREAILLASHELLAPDGMLIVYQFTTAVRPDLERIFGRVERRFELLNVLPAQLFFCERSAA